MIEITHQPIATDKVLVSVQSDRAGASVLFVGTTRQFTRDKETLQLDYECYEQMAIKKMQQLRDQALGKWSIIECSIVHRVGRVGLGEASIAVAVSTPHREASFEAAQWLVDMLKKQVPIWKREYWADGSQEWVHPDEAVIDQTDVTRSSSQ
jgi:molybdopterin synthase catalytic subunit